MSEYILELEKFGVAFGERIILSSVDLNLPVKGHLSLMGPAGTGKSTLLRSLCGINFANPSFRHWGSACYAGTELSEQLQGPALVSQNAKLMMSTVLENVVYDLPERSSLNKQQQIDVAVRLLQRAGLDSLVDKLDESVVNLPLGMQRHLAIVRTAAANPKLLCIDEPTTGIDDQYSEILLDYIAKEAEQRAVITILHHQGHAKRVGGLIALLAGGWIHEYRVSKEFFASPVSQAGKDFVRSGSCCATAPDADPESLEMAPDAAIAPPLPVEAKSYVSDALGPRNFLWLKKGMLAGTPQPGLITELDYDLKALKRVGVTVLVTLLEKPLPQSDELKDYQIENIWEPIDDMQPPEIEQAKKLCKRVDDLMREGEVVAYHCKAGLGRTGTMLAAQLIWEGENAFDALEKVRYIEPRWVQSEEQVKFLEAFADVVGSANNGKVAV